MGAPARIYRQLGTRLADLRAIRKLTQADIAERISRSPEYIGKIERGEKRVQIEDLARLANVLEVSLAEMFRGIRLETLRLTAREGRRAKYESSRKGPDEETVATLVQTLRSLEDDDVAALIVIARQLMAARLAK